LAKSADRTTLSLELFAEFSCYHWEREAPVDAFLNEVLLRRPDIALRDHDVAVLFQGETTSKEGRGLFTYRITGKLFGDVANPLLVSVRSGARASMPGMMDTVLNLGLNDETVEGLAKAARATALRL
jgi:hypothetical protein